MDTQRVQEIYKSLTGEDVDVHVLLHFGITEEQELELRTLLPQKFEEEIYNNNKYNVIEKFSLLVRLIRSKLLSNESSVPRALIKNYNDQILDSIASAYTALYIAGYFQRHANDQKDISLDKHVIKKNLITRINLTYPNEIQDVLTKIHENPSILYNVWRTVKTKTQVPMGTKKDAPSRYSTSNLDLQKKQSYLADVQRSSVNINDLYAKNSLFMKKRGHPYYVTNDFMSTVSQLLNSLDPNELICHWNDVQSSRWNRSVTEVGSFGFYEIPIKKLTKFAFELDKIIGCGLYIENGNSYIIFSICEAVNNDTYYFEPLTIHVSGGCDGTQFQLTRMLYTNFRGREFLYDSFRIIVNIPLPSNEHEGTMAKVELVNCLLDSSQQREFQKIKVIMNL
jgi:hypothetical protein